MDDGAVFGERAVVARAIILGAVGAPLDGAAEVRAGGLVGADFGFAEALEIDGSDGALLVAGPGVSALDEDLEETRWGAGRKEWELGKLDPGAVLGGFAQGRNKDGNAGGNRCENASTAEDVAGGSFDELTAIRRGGQRRIG